MSCDALGAAGPCRRPPTRPTATRALAAALAPAVPRRRRRPPGRRPRCRQDRVRPGLRRRPRCGGPRDEPDFRAGAALPLRARQPGAHADPRRRVPHRLGGRGGRPGAGRTGRRGRRRGGRVGRPGRAGAGRERARGDAGGARRGGDARGARSSRSSGRGRWAGRADEVAAVLDPAGGPGRAIESRWAATWPPVAIETATETVGVAVRTPDGVEAEFALTGRRRHVETLTPALEHLLAQVGLAPGDLRRSWSTSARAVHRAAGRGGRGQGPGAVAGHRGAVRHQPRRSSARRRGGGPRRARAGLRRRPARGGLRGRCAELDQRRRRRWQTARPGALVAPRDLAGPSAASAACPLCAVGDGAQRYREVLAAVPGVEVVAPALVVPATVDAAPARRWRASSEEKRQSTPASVVPLYMREADAKSNFVRAGARA